MKLSDVGNRVKTIFSSSSTDSTVERASQTREDRANVVLALRHDVRALQQEITDHSEAAKQDGASTGRTKDGAQMASLQRRLEEKQAELARYQARI